MRDLRSQLSRAIRHHGLFQPGETILVAVSGGVDSMVLLHLLHGLAKLERWKLVAAHFNHRLRGNASQADERLVRQTAPRLGLDLSSGAAAAKKAARADKISVEMAARKLRHEFLASAAAQCGAKKIALAHHADDQVELFFLRLLRGAGGQGIGGMRWQNPSPADPRLQLVRPLLDISKAELTTYAGAHKIPFREDASNRSAEFLRNRIRNELLPLLRQYQPGLDQTVPRLMAIMQAEGDYLDEQSRRWLATPSPFTKLPVALQRRVLGLQLLGLGVVPDFELIEALRSQPGGKVTGPGGKALRLNADGMIAELLAGGIHFSGAECQLSLDKQGTVQFADRQFDWEVEPCRSPVLPAKRQAGVEWFDAGQVGHTIVLRHWRRGDRFQPIGAAQPVKLQDFFANQKIPAAERHQRVVGVAEDGRIFWVEGLRISECFKLDKAARFTLKWQWRLVS